MARVIGVGAVMIYANDPPALAQWYTRTLGIETSGDPDSGCVYGVLVNPVTSVETQFAILRAREESAKTGRAVMVNYQVDDIEVFLNRVRSQDVVIETREDNQYGRFAHIKDIEGNPIEIWQAPPSGRC